jgi:sulfonate transport system ATP-binding protein
MHSLLGQLCERHTPATLLVTHDVDEAISLSDRILVVREGHISLDRRSSAEERCGGAKALALRTRLLKELGVHAPDVPKQN